MIDETITELTPLVGVRAACQAVGRSRATHYRHHRTTAVPPRPRREPARQPRALTVAEEQEVLSVLRSERFVDMAPAEIHAVLLDEGTYLCSVSTMYRLLRRHGEVRERRRQATHPARVKPELVADAPNRVWSWDITKLHGPAKWTYYYLYSIIDIFSRYTVGWMVATRESAPLAERLLMETINKQGVDRGQLSIHADNGSSMASKPVAFLLADLGVTKVAQPPARLQRQPLLRGPVQDPEVPPGVSPPVRLDRGRPRVLRRVLQLVQHRAPPLRDRHASAHRRPPRPGRHRPGPPHPGPDRRLRRPSRTLRPPPARPTGCQRTVGCPCGRTGDLPVGGQFISLSAVS